MSTSSARPHALLDGEVRLVDDLAEDPAEDQARSVGRDALDVLPELVKCRFGLPKASGSSLGPATISTSRASARVGSAT